MSLTRRDVLAGGLLSAGSLALRALCTGLPASFLAMSEKALADGGVPACADKSRAQYLILSTSAAGDPVNVNAPGTYSDLFTDIQHPQDPRMAPTPLLLGQQTVTAAMPWSTLPSWVLSRTCFFHHATLTNNHPNLPKVLRLMGATARQEMVTSIYAKQLAGCLGTVQTEPLSVGAGEILTFEGRALPNLRPTGLKDILTPGSLAGLQKLRDKELDRMYALVKQHGTTAQRAYVDSMALSRNQARSLSDQLTGSLDQIKSDDADGQVLAAATLIRMKVAPVIAVSIPFGGDNHFDKDLQMETAQTVSGVGQIGGLMALLKMYGIEDQVTFAMLNVFGRTLGYGAAVQQSGGQGRDHWANHHTTVLIGKHLRPGVIGGITPAQEGDYSALPIDSKSGAGQQGADVPYTETLSALGKTLGAALGLPQAVLDQNIAMGKVVTAALV